MNQKLSAKNLDVVYTLKYLKHFTFGTIPAISCDDVLPVLQFTGRRKPLVNECHTLANILLMELQ